MEIKQPKIDYVEFGEIVIGGKKFHQILISDGKVLERDSKKLEDIFGTTHFIGDWEKEMLLTSNPTTIIIGNGFQGILQIREDLIRQIKEKNIKLIVDYTPKAVTFYNQLIEKGEKVNALIHTTC